MLIKMLTRSVVLGAAVVGPMLFFRVSEIWAGAKKAIAAVAASVTDVETTSSEKAAPLVVKTAKPILAAGPSMEGPRVHALEEVLRFDVSTAWIMSRWARVSTGMAQVQLQGYRVLLVTGTAPDDLAGSLTYYFNPRQQVQKITFNGATGDATKLVRLLVSRYRFVRRLTNDGGLFVYEVPNVSQGGVRSILRIRPTGVVKADQPHQRFEIDLMLERPEPVTEQNSRPGFGLVGR